jgi:hypothetical protein
MRLSTVISVRLYVTINMSRTGESAFPQPTLTTIAIISVSAHSNVKNLKTSAELNVSWPMQRTFECQESENER